MGRRKGAHPSKGAKSYNVAYCYLPFVNEALPDDTAYSRFVDALEKSEAWEAVDERPSYLFRYIGDKYDRSSPDCQCHVYRLTRTATIELGFSRSRQWEPVPVSLPDPEGDRRFDVQDVFCCAFSTSVCILILKLRFATDDPYMVADLLYNLKKVRRQGIVPVGGGEFGSIAKVAHDSEGGLPLTSIGGEVLSRTGVSFGPRFFFYASEGKEHMNVLLHVSIPDDAGVDAERLLFYLGNTYRRTFDYDRRHSLPISMHWASKTTAWSYSPEAVACLTMPSRADTDDAKAFVMDGFRNNFTHHYQFLYLLLLHQKYEYYRLLMKIGAGEQRNREQLEAFRHELEIFRANFVFARVSETQQYQALYGAVANELQLGEMDRDTGEPIRALREMRRDDEAESRQVEELAERESDRRMERALNAVTVVAIVSALLDGLDLIGKYVPPTEKTSGLKVLLQLALTAILVGEAAWLLNEIRRH